MRRKKKKKILWKLGNVSVTNKKHENKQTNKTTNKKQKTKTNQNKLKQKIKRFS